MIFLSISNFYQSISLILDNAAHNSDLEELCREFLNKVQVNEEDNDYIHGDRISCLGLVKLVKGKLLMDINHQCIL